MGNILNRISTPQIKLPQGGGSVRGADENFNNNAFTGSANFSIPIPIPQARGLLPSIGVSYSSGSGNGLVGMGFNISESAIAIKTNRQLPKYDDTDIYAWNEAELVLKKDSKSIYLERHQASFPLIEKLVEDENVYWRVTGNDNSITIFGYSDDSKIVNPTNKNQIYKWLISEESDSQGNKIKYNYNKFEGTNSYLTSIEYGNYSLDGTEYFAFKVIIDYGLVSFKVEKEQLTISETIATPKQRIDVLTNYRAGFLIKTEYLVHSILIQHNFKKKTEDTYTHCTRFFFEEDEKSKLSFLKQVVQYGLKKAENQTYTFKSLPPIDLSFSLFNSADKNNQLSFTQIIDSDGRTINQTLNFVDFNKEGMAGIMYRDGDTLQYSRPLGNGEFSRATRTSLATNAIQIPNQFANPHIPLNLVSLEGNGQMQIELDYGQNSGYFPLEDEDKNWKSFIAFPNEQINNIPYRTEHIDVSGTNRNDQLIITPEKIYFRPSHGLQGISTQLIEIDNTTKVGAENLNKLNPYEYYGFSDFYGDGLSHRIKIKNKQLTIWPCLGYGRFAHKTIVDIPNFDFESQNIDLRKRLVLADVNGSGTTDIVLLYPDKIQVFFNQNGNSFSEPTDYLLPAEIQYSEFDYVQFHDVVGNGNTCLVFSKLSPHVFQEKYYDIAHYYCELNPCKEEGIKASPCNKAFMLRNINNNMGLENTLTYKSSLSDYFALQDTKDAWLTNLPFPTIVLNSSTIYDAISNSTFTSKYAYRNGYYDPNEHSFVGFGNVLEYDILDERKDNKALQNTLHKTWFHLGLGQTKIDIASEFYSGDKSMPNLPFHRIEDDTLNTPESLFAFAGNTLHSEVYETDYTGFNITNPCPYNVEQSCYTLLSSQNPSTNSKGVFKLFAIESLSINYEQRANDPHVSHHVVTKLDEYLNVLQQASVVYPRRNPLVKEQGILHVAASESTIYNQDQEENYRYIGIPLESKSFEVQHFKEPNNIYFTYDEIKKGIDEAFNNQITYSAESTNTCARLLSWSRQKYWANAEQENIWNESNVLTLVLPHHNESIVFDEKNIDDILGEKKSKIDFKKAGYIFENDYWWAKSAVAHYYKSIDEFYFLQQISYDWADKENYLYTETRVKYDEYLMFPLLSTVRYNDAVFIGTPAVMDYRTLSPWQVTDANGNKKEILTDELGMVVTTSSYEKDGINGDSPLALYKPKLVNDIADIFYNPIEYIQGSASFFYYDFPAKDKKGNWQPACAVALGRTKYALQNKEKQIICNEDIHIAISYSDGLGRTIEAKTFAGKENDNKWLASGRVIYNGKGEVTSSYFSYFSDTWKHITPAQWSSDIKDTLPPPTTFLYDAAGRNYQVNTPKGFFTRTLILNAWETQYFDESDTILESDYYKTFIKTDNNKEEQDALNKSIAFYNTPQTPIVDNLGRQILAASNNTENELWVDAPRIDWNKTYITKEEIDATNPNLLVQWQGFDIQGRPLLQADARLYEANQGKAEANKNHNFKHTYPIAGGLARSWSADAGESFGFTDVQGNALMSWDALGNLHQMDYDSLHRPLSHKITQVDGSTHSITATVYAESLLTQGKTLTDLQNENCIGSAIAMYDNAGLTISKDFTFDGHVLKSKRTFRKDYKSDANWTAANILTANTILEEDVFDTTATFDAIGRPLSQTLPDGSITTWQYGMMGNCTQSGITLNGAITKQIIVSNSKLNQFGQLVNVKLNNGVTTSHNYDSLTQQLLQIKSTKGNKALQDQNYWHDPTGLITTMQNNVAAVVYANNQEVKPENTYTYDALYRLKNATGRIQLSKTMAPIGKNRQDKLGHVKNYQNANLQAVGNYAENYQYDKGNNLTQLQRTGDNPFTRLFTINSNNNRVSQYQQGKTSTTIDYDTSGQMQNINGNGSQKITWNSIGNIANATLVDRGNEDKNDMEYYVYDASGIRVRKVTERKNSDGTILSSDDKRYIGNYRFTSKTNADTRHSITVGGVQKQDCIVQYTTDTNKKTTAAGIIYRYQHANHLNSIGLETNQAGDVISYEEYSPFGDTVLSYDPVNLDSSKEYRYSAQEKDDSTGLYYYGYRYYAPWLCRWTRPDPAGTIDGFNLYGFVGNEPIGKEDVMGLVTGDENPGEGTKNKKKKTQNAVKEKKAEKAKPKKNQVKHNEDDEVDLKNGKKKKKLTEIQKKNKEAGQNWKIKAKENSKLSEKQNDLILFHKNILFFIEDQYPNNEVFNSDKNLRATNFAKGFKSYIEEAENENFNHPSIPWEESNRNNVNLVLSQIEMSRSEGVFIPSLILKSRQISRHIDDDDYIKGKLKDYYNHDKYGTFEGKGVSGKDYQEFIGLVAKNTIHLLDTVSEVGSYEAGLKNYLEDPKNVKHYLDLEEKTCIHLFDEIDMIDPIKYFAKGENYHFSNNSAKMLEARRNLNTKVS